MPYIFTTWWYDIVKWDQYICRSKKYFTKIWITMREKLNIRGTALLKWLAKKEKYQKDTVNRAILVPPKNFCKWGGVQIKEIAIAIIVPYRSHSHQGRAIWWSTKMAEMIRLLCCFGGHPDPTRDINAFRYMTFIHSKTEYLLCERFFLRVCDGYKQL